MPEVATVPVKSATRSKINWTQGVAIVAMLLSYFGFDLPPEQQTVIVGAIGIVSALVTWVLRTWFNRTVTPSR